VRALVERPIIIVYALKADRIEVLRFWHGARGRPKIS
jgi:plasmid stabilization system protein ParE